VTIIARYAYPLFLTITSERLLELLTQETPNAIVIGTTVVIGGADVSESVESVITRSDDQSAMGTADIRFVGEKPAEMVTGASVAIYDVFTFEDGSTFTAQIFSGTVQQLKDETNGAGETETRVVTQDSATDALSTAPSNTTWSGTARTLVVNELTTAGLDTADVDFPDYTLPDNTPLTQYPTVRDLVAAVSAGLADDPMWTSPTGILCIRDADNNATAPWSLKRTGYVSSKDDDDASARYASYTVQGATGETYTATGTGTAVGSETTDLLTSEADLQTKAEAVVARAERIKRTVEMPANPLARVGDIVMGAEHIDGTTFDGRIMSVTHTRQWPGGCWTAIQFEVIP
jgi:hypothetical protein